MPLPQRSLASSERLRSGHVLDHDPVLSLTMTLSCPVLYVFLSPPPPHLPRVHDHVLSMCSLYRPPRQPCWLSCPPTLPFPTPSTPHISIQLDGLPSRIQQLNCTLHYLPHTNVQRNLEEEGGQGDTHLSPWRMPRMLPTPSEK